MGMKKKLNRFFKGQRKEDKKLFLEEYAELCKRRRYQFIPTLSPIDWRTVKAVQIIKEISKETLKKLDADAIKEIADEQLKDKIEREKRETEKKDGGNTPSPEKTL